MKIYVSSTFADLNEYRASVIDAIISMGHTPVSMEHYVAENQFPLDKVLKDVAGCDLLIGIIAWRYGFIAQGQELSITELEYREALKKGIPALIFLLDEEFAWPPRFIDHGDDYKHILSLRNELKLRHLVSFFSTPNDLKAKASQAIAIHNPIKPGIKPISETENFESPRVSLLRLPITGAAEFGRDDEMKLINEAWDSAKTTIVTIVAWGGVGKSALINSWLASQASKNYSGAHMVFGWSFYNQEMENQEASADVFITEALIWFNDQHPNLGSPWERGQRLAELLRKQKCLLILDGLEVLQDPLPPDEGRLKDQSILALLRHLASQNPGLCIITTRLPVIDLQPFLNNTVKGIFLEHLTPESGAELLAKIGVRGTKSELMEAAKEFEGHALALTLLGSYLVEAREGDVRWWRDIHEESDQARRMIGSYERWLGEGPELDIIRLIGLFNGPASNTALATLRTPPIIPGLTDHLVGISNVNWNRSINKLRKLKLLAEKNPDRQDFLDTHPLVRQHFSQQLQGTNPSAWKEANNRLYEYYKKLPKLELPDTLSEMAHLFQAVMHGCRAERYQEAFNEVYWPRIRRGDDGYSVLSLNAYGADLVALTGFFEECWDTPSPALDEQSCARLYTEAAFDLRGLGRLEDSISTQRRGLIALQSLEMWVGAANAAGNLSETLATSGSLIEAIEMAQLSVGLAQKAGNNEMLVTNIATLADTLHQIGRFREAEEKFIEAESLLNRIRPEIQLLHALRGYHYCDLLLGLGKLDEVKVHAMASLKVDTKRLYAIALAHLALARMHMQMGELSQSTDLMRQSIDELRLAGHQELLVRGWLASAELDCLTGNYTQAEKTLNESMSTAVRNQMRIHEADACIQYTHLKLKLGIKEDAKKYFEASKSKINAMGYHRRDNDIQILEAGLISKNQ